MKMTLDEGIKLCEDIMREQNKLAEECEYKYEKNLIAGMVETYSQFAEWLKDYKRLLEKENFGEKHHCVTCKYSNHLSGKCMNVDSCLCGEKITPNDWCTNWEG